jgi:hypothetical protein
MSDQSQPKMEELTLPLWHKQVPVAADHFLQATETCQPSLRKVCRKGG